jgi:hypothetical protein
MEKMTLVSTEPSPCCSGDAQIVLSHPGGFISRDCLKCGRSHYVREDQLHTLPCEACQLPPCELTSWTEQITSTRAHRVGNSARSLTLCLSGAKGSDILDWRPMVIR